MAELSVVIPVRDEEENVIELVSRLSIVIDGLNLVYEIIFVTDNNKDNTLEVLKSLNKKDDRVKIVKLSNSFGQHVAILAGLNFSQGNIIVIMDGDLQDHPEDIPKLYKKLKEGYDVVYGVKKRKNDSYLRNFFSKAFVKMLNMLCDYSIEINSCMFRMLSRKVVNELLKFNEKQILLTGLISIIGFPSARAEVTSGKRIKGETKYSFLRQVNLAISSVLSFSSKPIRMVSIFGFIVSSLSLFYFFIVIIQKLVFGFGILGWPTVVSLITFLGGVQLLAIGIVGEYIGRIFIETKNRPLYIIEESIGDFE